MHAVDGQVHDHHVIVLGPPAGQIHEQFGLLDPVVGLSHPQDLSGSRSLGKAWGQVDGIGNDDRVSSEMSFRKLSLPGSLHENQVGVLDCIGQQEAQLAVDIRRGRPGVRGRANILVGSGDHDEFFAAAAAVIGKIGRQIMVAVREIDLGADFVVDPDLSIDDRVRPNAPPKRLATQEGRGLTDPGFHCCHRITEFSEHVDHATRGMGFQVEPPFGPER